MSVLVRLRLVLVIVIVIVIVTVRVRVVVRVIVIVRVRVIVMVIVIVLVLLLLVIVVVVVLFYWLNETSNTIAYECSMRVAAPPRSPFRFLSGAPKVGFSKGGLARNHVSFVFVKTNITNKTHSLPDLPSHLRPSP